MSTQNEGGSHPRTEVLVPEEEKIHPKLYRVAAELENKANTTAITAEMMFSTCMAVLFEEAEDDYLRPIDQDGPSSATQAPDASGGQAAGPKQFKVWDVFFSYKDRMLHWLPEIRDAALENGADPELLSPELLSKAFVVLMHLRERELSSSGRGPGAPYPFALENGKLHLHPDVRASGDPEALCASSEKLTQAFMVGLLLKWKAVDPHANCAISILHAMSEGRGEWRNWAFRFEGGEVHLTEEVRAALIQNGVPERLTTPEQLTKVFEATSCYKIMTELSFCDDCREQEEDEKIQPKSNQVAAELENKADHPSEIILRACTDSLFLTVEDDYLSPVAELFPEGEDWDLSVRDGNVFLRAKSSPAPADANGDRDGPWSATRAPDASGGKAEGPERFKFVDLFFSYEDRMLHWLPEIRDAALENGADPELLSPELLSKAFVVLMHLRERELSSSGRDPGAPYPIALENGKLHLHPDVRASVQTEGPEALFTSSEKLTRAFMVGQLLGWKAAQPVLRCVFSISDAKDEGLGEWRTWAFRFKRGKVSLNEEVRAALIQNGVPERLTTPEQLTKVFEATSCYKIITGLFPAALG